MQYEAKLILLLMALAMMLIFSGTVLANGPPPSDGEDLTDQGVLEELVRRLQDGETLTDNEMDAVVQNYLSVASVELIEPEIAADGIAGCDTHTRIYQAKNGFNIVLYELGSETYWCFDGYLIDGTPEWDVWGDASGLWWEYVGNVNESEHGGDGDEYHKDYVQAHFRLCPPLLGCIAHEYPWIRKWQYGTGQKSYEWGS